MPKKGDAPSSYRLLLVAPELEALIAASQAFRCFAKIAKIGFHRLARKAGDRLSALRVLRALTQPVFINLKKNDV